MFMTHLLRPNSGMAGLPSAGLVPRGSCLAAVLGVILGGGMLVSSAQADGRKYTYVYETTTMPKGMVEYEQWVTWKTHKGNDSGFDQLDFRHEIEFGVTDDFQLAIYLSDWRYKDGSSVEDDGSEWRDVAVEGIYSLMNPVTDVFGLGLYGEVKIGDEFLELEGKVLLEKYFGLVNVAYNATIEAEWEDSHFGDDSGKFQQVVGVSYEVKPQFSIGAEFLHEIKFPDWSSQDDDVVYLGPNFSWRKNKFFITVTPLFQLTTNEDQADFQTRMIFGIAF